MRTHLCVLYQNLNIYSAKLKIVLFGILMQHYDYNNSEANWDVMPSGFLRIWGTIAKVGWLQYQNTDGSTRWEYVSPEVLFNVDHLESIAGSPLTLSHPVNPITPSNYKQFVVGSTGTKVVARADKGVVDIITVVCDQEAIDSVMSGKTRQLSMGYEADLEPRSDGKFNQIKRVCNHNALVELARAGPEACLHLDGWQQVDYKEQIIEVINKDANTWRTIRVMV